MQTKFEGIYRLNKYQPKDKSSGAIIILTFHKSMDTTEGEKLMRLFKKYVKYSICTEETESHLIEGEARIITVVPETLNRLNYLRFSISIDHDEERAVNIARLWDKNCKIELEEIERELPLDSEEEDTEDEDAE